MKKIILIFLFLTKLSWAGHENGHGGDAIAANFVSIAYDVLSDLYTEPIKEIDTKRLSQAISKTSVRSSKDKLFDITAGAQVDAINHPTKKVPEIVVSRKRWGSIREVYQKRRLVLHEYLNIMGVNDKKYEVSSLIDRAKICGHELKSVYEKTFGKISCDKIHYRNLKELTSLDLTGVKTGNIFSKNQLSHLDLSKVNLVLKDSLLLDDSVSQKLRYLTTELRPSNRMDIARFTKLKRLEAKLFLDLKSSFLSKNLELEEVVFVSSLKEKIYLKDNFFKGTKLKRLVLCDTGESIKNDYVRIPHIEPDSRALQGLESVEEATLCFTTNNKKSLTPKLLGDLSNIKKLWIKFDDWSKLPSDFFEHIPKGTKVALIPSGKVFEPSITDKFKDLTCNNKTKWAKNDKKITGKVYCKRTN